MMVRISFSETDGGPIVGYAYGTREAAEQCAQMVSREEEVRLESLDQGPRLVAENLILWPQQVIPGWPQPAGVDGIRRVARFRCASVEYTTRRSAQNSEREVDLRLVGGTDFLLNRELPTYKRSGERSIEHFESPVLIERDTVFPGAIELGGTYHWILSKHGKSGSFVRLPELRFKVADPEPSDDEVVALAKTVAEDLTKLMSFAARGSVGWYQMDLAGAGQYRVFRAPSSRRRDGKPKYRTVTPNAERRFLVHSLPRLRALRESGLDLSLAMVYLVPSHSFRYVEERFAMAYLGLEKLVHVLVGPRGRGRIFDESSASRIRRAVRAMLQESVGGVSVWAKPVPMLFDKLAELNRPAFRDQLRWVCEEHGVEWRDLYPPDFTGPHPRFIQTRNRLFHSSSPVEDGGPIMRESLRVLAVSERIILALLGWPDQSGTSARSYRLRLDREI